MESVRAQFPQGETYSLLRKFPSLQMLSWDQIHHLPARVTVGSHGVSHEIHHARQESNVRQLELCQSRIELEQQLGRPCKYFAYPNGNSHDLSPLEAEAAGYEMAFTMNAGTITRQTNRFLLPRFTAPASFDSLKETIYSAS